MQRRRWRADLERSLTEAPREWVRAAGPPGSETLSTDQAWVLLSWVENAASETVSRRRGAGDLVETAAFALALQEAGPLDRRDVMLVASVVRRAAAHAGLPFGDLVRRGCGRAGDLGVQCQQWLLDVSSGRPGTIPRDAPERDGSWSPRYALVAVVLAAVLIGAIVAAYDQGWLPVAGPFVATILAATVIVLAATWRARRIRRITADAVRRLQDLRDAIARERALDPTDRPTAATDRSLHDAAEHVDLALQQLAWGQERRAARFVHELDAIAADQWRQDAPLSQDVARLTRTTARLDAQLARLETVTRGTASARR